MALTINSNLNALTTSRALARHYGGLSTSIRRLSSGLRVGRAADDAAGLAIREFMRSDIAALKQGIRNANDAISMIQTADGALAIIDEKLIRMKELAMQASTGTYTSDQRLIIDSEYQQMAKEIARIAASTEYNGIHLLDGGLQGKHDGSGLTSQGALKVHFGPGNSQAEDYYYLSMWDASPEGLGIQTPFDGIDTVLKNGEAIGKRYISGLVSFGLIPKGAKNVKIHMWSGGVNDTLQLFSRSGKHLVGTNVGTDVWDLPPINVQTGQDINDRVLNAGNGFYSDAVYDSSTLNGGRGTNIGYNATPPYTPCSYNGMNIGFSGDGLAGGYWDEYLVIDEVTEDLILMVVGWGEFEIEASWSDMEGSYVKGSDAISIQTQTDAQKSLPALDKGIGRVSAMRASLGASQNRLENTVTSLQIQSESAQAAESRISDVDAAREMTRFTKTSILVQASVAMLTQAQHLPRMALRLLQS